MSSLTSRRWIPGPRLYLGLGGLSLTAFLLVVLASFFSWDVSLGLGGAIMTAAVIVVITDHIMSRQWPPVQIERVIAGNISVNKWAKVTLNLQHEFNKPIQIKLFDAVSETVEQQGLPLTATLLPQRKTQVQYSLRPLERGPLTIAPCYVEIPSPLGLWLVRYQTGEASSIKVFPDFMAIATYTILATDNHTSQIGIMKKPRRGTGLEFQQLREYRRGDSLRQVDWKATARRQKLIAREYQDERDQQIVLLIDSGRRMRAKDDALSHFDHSLNAMLLVSFIALRQGDSVSVMSFGNVNRWVPPQKGVDRIKNVLEGMYDLQAGQCAPDYTAAAEKLSALQQKRSLVILVTNSRDEDIDELLLSANLLKRRHLVLIANIREMVLDELTHKPVTNLDEALSYAGVQHYLNSRLEMQRKLRSAGVYSVDCTAKDLAVQVANSYLEIKSAGVL